MRTPSGVECPYFYGDYFRGKHVEECRLLSSGKNGKDWSSDLCKTCRVPAIKRANACENMTLYATVKKGVGKLGRRVIVTAYCSKANAEVKIPEIGCGLCHEEIPSRDNQTNE